jgi:isocitrate lyase
VGAIDPVQMTQQAPHQEILYVSGWACSAVLTTTNEVSPDFGDYPYNTVPNQVQRMFKAQQLHDRKHYDQRRSLTADQRKQTPYVDYLRPIVADGDTGHGGLSRRMVLRLFTSRTSFMVARSADIWLAKSSFLSASTSTDSMLLASSGI